MQAIVVAPAPAQPPQQFNSKNSGSAGDDSTFAPELSKALSGREKPASSARPGRAADDAADDAASETATETATQAGAKPGADKKSEPAEKADEHELEDSPETAVGLADPGDDQTETRPEKIGRNGNARGPAEAALAHAADRIGNSIAREKSALFKFAAGATEAAGALAGKDKSQADTAFESAALKRLAATAPETSPLSPKSHTQARVEAQLGSGAALDKIMTGQANGEPAKRGGALGQTTSASFNLVNGKDSLTWTQTAGKMPRDMVQQQASPHLLMQRMDNLQQGRDTSTLSTESILARLSQISAEQPQAPLRAETSLRESATAGIRHDITGQFIQAKTDLKEANSDGQGGQQFLDAEGNLAKQHALSNSLGRPVDGQGDSSFSQALNHAADRPQQPLADLSRPGAVPFSPQQVSDNEILNQVTQRLRFSAQMQDTKLVMRLHPAELGSLKLDIHLKDGLVNANIVAQSQQVQEVLEKHMPRLRGLMQESGLQVGEITIRLDSDLPSEQNLFDEELAQQHDSGTQGGTSTTSAADFVLDQLEEESEGAPGEDNKSVNLKA